MRWLSALVVVLVVGCGGSGDAPSDGSADQKGACVDTAPSASEDVCVPCTGGSCACQSDDPGMRGYACFGGALFPACDDHCSSDLVARKAGDGPWFGCTFCGDSGR